MHHVEARVFKDVFPRFKTMQGHHVVRKAGWDCHGLPGRDRGGEGARLLRQGDIEAYGVAEFNEKCRESVERHVDEFEAMTERMGYWVDMTQPYRTMDPAYVESVWWSLKQVFDKGLLVEDHRVAPYCPRCGTGLSDHELAQPGLRDRRRPERLRAVPADQRPVRREGRPARLDHHAVDAGVQHRRRGPPRRHLRDGDATSTETLVVAEPLVESALGEGWQVQDRFPGQEMERWTLPAAVRPRRLAGRTRTRPLRRAGRLRHHRRRHRAGAPGARVRRRGPRGQPGLRPAGGQPGPPGRPLPGLGARSSAGSSSRAPTSRWSRDLSARGLLFRQQAYEHAYPHCWRCHTALLYYAQPSWYIRTTAIKDALLGENERTNWFPENIKRGRYGDWLHNNIDWALSRTRYWGTPLPDLALRRADPTQLVCVGSLAELGELAGHDLTGTRPAPAVRRRHHVPLHGPAMPAPRMRRVPEVIDGWYDSGSMPFAQWGYPHAAGLGGAVRRGATRRSSSARRSTRPAAGSTR